MFHNMSVVSGDEIQHYRYRQWWSGVMELGAPPWEEVPSEYKDSTKKVIDWLNKEKGIPIFSQLRDTILYGRPPKESPSDVTVEVWLSNAREFLDKFVNGACTFKRRRQLVPLMLKMGATILTLRNKEGAMFGSIICTTEMNDNAIVVMSTTEGRQKTVMLLTSALGLDGWLTRKAIPDYGMEEFYEVDELKDPFIIYAPWVDLGVVERETPDDLTDKVTGETNKFCEVCGHRVRRLSCTPGDRNHVVCKECGGWQSRISSDEEEKVTESLPTQTNVWFAPLLDKMNKHSQLNVAREVNRVTHNALECVTLRLGSKILRNLTGHQVNVVALILHNDREGNNIEKLVETLHSTRAHELYTYGVLWWAYMCLIWGGQYPIECPTSSYHAESFAEVLATMLDLVHDGEYWVALDGRKVRTCSQLVVEELMARGCFPIEHVEF